MGKGSRSAAASGAIVAKGLIMGKRGAKRRTASKALRAAKHLQSTKKGDHGYAKKAKRRALRNIIVPSELKKGKRTPKDLLVESMLVREGLQQQERDTAANARMIDN